MSVMVLSDKAITGMLQAAAPAHENETPDYPFNGRRRPFFFQAGQILLRENYRSYCARYRQQIPTDLRYLGNQQVRKLTAVEIIRLCDSYIYNASEAPGWKESEACAIATELKNRACRMLPGYDQAAIDL